MPRLVQTSLPKDSIIKKKDERVGSVESSGRRNRDLSGGLQKKDQAVRMRAARAPEWSAGVERSGITSEKNLSSPREY